MTHKKGIVALSPLIVFVVLYLTTSLIVQDFYKIPIIVAFLISSAYSIVVIGKGTVNKRIETFCKGAGSSNVLLMIVIFILAGAFASTAKDIGSVDATVNLALAILPDKMIIAGLFLAACIVSLAVGTSVGTIAALVPIATGIAEQTEFGTSYLVAAVVGGALFGDNLSFISDTTIMATKTLGCKMSDKFHANIYISLPAAIIVFAIYIVAGTKIDAVSSHQLLDIYKVLPYIVVLLTAIFGVNVMIVLSVGIAMCGIIGILDSSFDIFGFMASMNNGIMSMSELIIVTILAAGMLEMISKAHGIDYITEMLARKIKNKRGAEFSLGVMVCLTDICTANNTIAILTVGNISRKIADKYNIDKRKAASILDTFSCSMQGILPYGAQILIAAGLAGINPIEIIPYLYYPFVLGIVTILSITFRFPKIFS